MLNFRVFGVFIAGVSLLSLSGCSLLKLMDDEVPPPPSVQRQARLLQVPDDLRLPRDTTLRAVFPPNVAPLAAPMPGALVPAAPIVVAPPPASAAVPSAITSSAIAVDVSKMMFAPYVPTSKESLPPRSWELDPKHDFPWIAGAQPARVNEETTVGVGPRMFGRLFAKIEFGKGAVGQTTNPKVEVVTPPPKKEKSGNFISRWFNSDADQKKTAAMPTTVAIEKTSLHASDVICASTTCLDAARDMLIDDAQAKGWTMLLNRRVSMHQSFQFQRVDRVIWVEVTSTGKNVLQLEYNILPIQESPAR
jgi:hypothetical protein